MKQPGIALTHRHFGDSLVHEQPLDTWTSQVLPTDESPTDLVTTLGHLDSVQAVQNTLYSM